MSDGHGGYRKPRKPAPEGSSGPGKYSKRTDGGPSMQEKQAIRYIGGGGYGESKELTELQQGAPMAAAARPQSTGASPNPQSTGSAPPAPPNLVPFNAPTQYEDEPLSNGAPWGAGLNAPPLQAPEGLDDTDRQRALFLLGMLEKAAEQPNASRATRQLVRRLRSEL